MVIPGKKDIPRLAVVLAGGKGTRLHGVILGPKILVRFAGRPFLDHLLRWLAAEGIREVVLLTGFGHRAIGEYARDGRRWGLRVRYVTESPGRLLGTGGAVRRALSAIRDDAFFLMNGDSFFPVSLAPLADLHRRRNARVTLAVTRVPEVSRFGAVLRDRAGRGTAFLEKGRRGPGWVNMGLYVVRREAIARLPAGRPASIERDLFPALVGRGLWTWPAPVGHLDFGTPESLREALRKYGTAENGKWRMERNG